MNKEEYWQAHVAKNPKFVDESHEIEIRISVGMLKKLLFEAHDKGFEHSRKIRQNFNDVLRKSGFDPSIFK